MMLIPDVSELVKHLSDEIEKLKSEKKYWNNLYNLCKSEKNKLDGTVEKLEAALDAKKDEWIEIGKNSVIEAEHEAYLKGYKEGTAAVFEIWDRVRAK